MKVYVILASLFVLGLKVNGQSYNSDDGYGDGNEDILASTRHNKPIPTTEKPQSSLSNYQDRNLKAEFLALKEYINLQLHREEKERIRLKSIRDEAMPKFEDPIIIGDVYEKYKLADVNFTKVVLKGLSNFKQANLNEKMLYKVNLTSAAEKSLEIAGNYSLKNFFKTATGAFNVKLSNVNYYEEFSYEGDHADLKTTGSKLNHEIAENAFEDIGFFTNLFRNAIGNKLIQQVSDQVSQKMSAQMNPIVTERMHAIVQTYRRPSLLRDLERKLNETILDAHKYLTNGMEFVLPGLKETNSTNGAVAFTFMGMDLVGLDKFVLLKSKVELNSSGIYRFRVVLNFPAVEAEAIYNASSISVKSSRNKLEAPKSFVARVVIEPLEFDILVEKNAFSIIDELELSRVNVSASRVQTSINVGETDWDHNMRNAVAENITPVVQTNVEIGFATVIKEYFGNELKISEKLANKTPSKNRWNFSLF